MLLDDPSDLDVPAVAGTLERSQAVAVGACQADGTVRPEPTFDPQHVADAVVAVAQLPLGVSVPAMTILVTGMPYAGRG